MTIIELIEHLEDLKSDYESILVEDIMSGQDYYGKEGEENLQALVETIQLLKNKNNLKNFKAEII